MARVQVAAQPWGQLIDEHGDARVDFAVALTQLDGTTPVVLYDAATAGNPVAAITDAFGHLPGYVDEGTYLFTVAGETYQVEALQAAASLSRTPPSGTVGTTQLVDGSVTNAKLGSGAVDAGKVAAALKPSGSAAAGTEALRAIGTAADTAAAGNDARITGAEQTANKGVTYAGLDGGANVPAANMRAFNDRGPIAASTSYSKWDIAIYQGRRVLFTQATSSDGAGALTTNTYESFGGRSVINVLDHGVVGDGVTDDTQHIKSLCDAYLPLGYELYFPPVDYASSWFYVNQVPRLVFAPGARVLMTQTNDSWNFGATTPTSTRTLSGDIAAGATVISGLSSTTGIAADDIVALADSANKVGGSSATNTVSANNMYRVKSVDSASQITLAQPLIYAIPAATGSLQVLDMKKRGYVRGLYAESTNGATSTPSVIRFWYCRDLDFEISAKGFGNAGAILQDCYKFRGRANIEKFYDVAKTGITGQFGYGVVLSGASCHGSLELNVDQARHAMSCAGTGHNVKATGVASACTSGAVDAHAGFTNVEFNDWVIDQVPDGAAFNLRGDRYRINGGSVDNCKYGVYIFDRPVGCSVRGLHIKNCDNGIMLNGVGGSPGQAVTISDNTIDDSRLAAVQVDAGFSWQDVRITNNSIRNAWKGSSGAAINVQGTVTRGRVLRNLVEDNQGSPTTTAVINLTAAATDFLVDKNDNPGSLTLISGSQSATATVPPSIFTPTKTVYSAAGSYSFAVPAGAANVIVTAIGGGGGGGSGRQGAALSARIGGGGGGGGGFTQYRFAAADLSSPVTVTVGAGGAGGTAQATADTNGSAGGGGGATTFGTYVRATGGSGGSAGGIAAGGNAGGGVGQSNGAPGGSTTTSAGNGSNFTGASGGGGGGGSITTGDAASNGGSGANSAAHNQGTVGSAGTAGGAGGNATAPTLAGLPGIGGGGGASSITANGGAGGNAAGGGGGGGGGGASLDTHSSGAGGNGSDGQVVVICT